MIPQPHSHRIGLAILFGTLAGHVVAAEHRYTLRVSADLERVEVEARLGTAVRYLSARSGDATALLRRVSDCDGRKPRLVNRHIEFQGGAADCVRYTARLAEQRPQRAAGAPGDAHRYRVSRPDDWLWLPPRRTGGEISVETVLPRGVLASLPWTPLDGATNRYVIPVSPASGRSLAVFGRFETARVEVPGAVLRVAYLGDGGSAGFDKLTSWVAAAAGNVAGAYGAFPNPAPQVLLFESPSSGDSPVPFGSVSRNGGESVHFYVDSGRDIEELLGDWTATHEFAHLLMPYVRERWISEGFATYYQNVLLGRAGIYTETKVWERLSTGLARGALSVPEQSPGDASRAGLGAGRMKVYWAGAALALMADIEIRRRSGGKRSLDDLLREFAGCCLPAERSYRAREWLQQLDSYLDAPVLTRLYDRYANEPGFPEYDTLLHELGVEPGASLRLLNDRVLSVTRKALLQ